MLFNYITTEKEKTAKTYINYILLVFPYVIGQTLAYPQKGYVKKGPICLVQDAIIEDIFYFARYFLCLLYFLFF